MKAINKILTLHKTNLIELETLEIDWYINGCGGQWGFNFDRYLKEILENEKLFKEEKRPELYRDLRIICLCHDRAFHYKKGFYLSNYRMARDIFILTHKFVWFFLRLWLAVWFFILLCKFWKTYYK